MSISKRRISISLLVFVAGVSASGNVGAIPAEPYTPDVPRRPRVLMDYYHHAKPQLTIGKYIVTGAWADNLGRYGFDDFSHPNSFDPLIQALEKEFALLVHEQPFTRDHLEGVDIVFIFTPDSTQVRAGAPPISDREIDDLREFVRQGGSLMLMVNSHHETEKFEQAQLRKLFRQFGLDWLENDTKYVDITVGPEHPFFYDIDIFHYGAGCTFRYLTDNKPQTLLHVHGDVGDEEVQGPGVAMVRFGEGKVIACGDTGSWGGNMSRPWAENHRFLVQMFRYLKRDTGIRAPTYRVGQKLHYKMTVAQTFGTPWLNSLQNLPQPNSELFVPRKKTRIPYLESTAEVELTCTDIGDIGAMQFSIAVEDWRRFDQPVTGGSQAPILIRSNRQGAIAELECASRELLPIAPDLSHLIAFVPNDGVRIGDRWKKLCSFKINPIQMVDTGTVRPVETEMCYVRDEPIGERKCRLMLTSGVGWLSELEVSIEDLLPKDEVRLWGGSHYKYHTPRGGRFLVKRGHWVDRASGIVVRAKVQSRIAAWIRDLRKPVGKTKADIDNDMVTLAAQTVLFELQ